MRRIFQHRGIQLSFDLSEDPETLLGALRRNPNKEDLLPGFKKRSGELHSIRKLRELLGVSDCYDLMVLLLEKSSPVIHRETRLENLQRKKMRVVGILIHNILQMEGMRPTENSILRALEDARLNYDKPEDEVVHEAFQYFRSHHAISENIVEKHFFCKKGVAAVLPRLKKICEQLKEKSGKISLKYRSGDELLICKLLLPYVIS